MTFYSGMFKDSEYNGFGTYIQKNKLIYEGSFVNGKFEGNGIIKDPNGD